MFKKIVLVILVVILAAFGYASTKPDTFRIERTAFIKATPETIFPHLNDLHKSLAWSPWQKKDPNMKMTFSGPASGKGAAYTWDGNSEVGAGRMEIIDVSEPGKVVVQLDFFKPFKGQSTGEFTLAKQGDGTTITWAMYGEQPFIGKVMSLFFDCDKIVGKDFETGLANLKALTEQ